MHTSYWYIAHKSQISLLRDGLEPHLVMAVEYCVRAVVTNNVIIVNTI